MSVTSENPNATIAASSTSAGVIVIYLLGLVGVSPQPEVAAAIAGTATTLLIFIGRAGIKGFFKTLWRGQGGTPPP